MNLHQQCSDYLARPVRSAPCGFNVGFQGQPFEAEGNPLKGISFNAKRLPVEMPAFFTSPSAVHCPDDAKGERMAAGIMRAIEFSEPLAHALGVDVDTLTGAAACGFASGFAYGIRAVAIRGRDDGVRKLPASWRGCIEAAVSTLKRTGSWSRAGAAVADAAGVQCLPDEVLGIVSAALAVVELAHVAPSTVAARPRDPRLDAGAAHVRVELHAIATQLGAPASTAAEIAQRGVDRYEAVFSAIRLTARFPKHEANAAECSGTGIRRAVEAALAVPAAAPLDVAVSTADVVEGCTRADAGSFESACAQGLAVIRVAPLLLALKGKDDR